MIRAQNGLSRIEIARRALRAEIDRAGASPRKISLDINPGSPNLLAPFLRGGGISLKSFLDAERELGLPLGEMLRNEGGASRVDLDALLEAVNQSPNKPSPMGPNLEDFLSWYHRTGGMVADSDPMLRYMDIYGEPKSEGVKVNPIRMGESSLATKSIGTRSVDGILDLLARTNQTFCDESANTHRQAFGGKDILDERAVREILTNGTAISVRFARAVRRGKWGGAEVILSFARHLS